MYRNSNALKKVECENKIDIEKKSKVIRLKKSKMKYLKNRILNTLIFVFAFLVAFGCSFIYLLGQAKSNESTYRKSKSEKPDFSRNDNIKQKEVKNTKNIQCVSRAIEDKAVII